MAYSEEEEIKRTLIKKYLEFNLGGFFSSSVKHYSDTGKVSGSLFMNLKDMLEEMANITNEQPKCDNCDKCSCGRIENK